MKIYKLLSLLSIGITLFILSSCRNSDSIGNGRYHSGNLQIKFENGFNNLGDIVLGRQTVQTSSGGQKHNFTILKYIVSNIVLIDENGKEFKYNYNNSDKGAFIIDQAEARQELSTLIWQIFHGNNYKKSDSDLVSVSRLTFWDRTGRYFLAKGKGCRNGIWSWLPDIFSQNLKAITDQQLRTPNL